MAPISDRADINDNRTNQSGNLKPRKGALHRNVVRKHHQVKIPSSLKRPLESKKIVPFHSQGKDLGGAKEDSKGTTKSHATHKMLDHNGENTASTLEKDKALKSLHKIGGLHLDSRVKSSSFQTLSEDVMQERLRDDSHGKAVLDGVIHANLAHRKCTARSSQIKQGSVIGCSMRPFDKEKPQLPRTQEQALVPQPMEIPRKRSKVCDEATMPQLLLGARNMKNDQEAMLVNNSFDREWPNPGNQENQNSKALSLRKLLSSDVNVKPSWVHGMQEISCQLELDLTADLPFSPNDRGSMASESVSRVNQMTEDSAIQTVETFCMQSNSTNDVKHIHDFLGEDGEELASSSKRDARTINENKHGSTALSEPKKSKSMHEQLEISLHERNCERAMEAFMAWKREDFKVEPRRIEKLGKERSDCEMMQDIPGKKRGFIVSIDISRGLETLPISCVNEYNTDMLPEDFLYMTYSVISAGAHVDRSFSRIGDLHCNCSDDCLKSSEACKCTDSTRGECAYEEKGQLIARLATSFQSRYGTERGDFITECCAKCRCSKQCGNRVVQRGITKKLQVFMTPNKKGWGVRALERIPAHSFVFEYIGEIATNYEQIDRNKDYAKKGVHTYTLNLDADYDMEQRHFGDGLSDKELLVLDATHYGNVARFVNHRCQDANLFFRPVQIETRDTHYYHVGFFAVRDIEEMEELTWDYTIDFEDNENTAKAFKCRCNSTFCRDKPKKKKNGKPVLMK